MKKEDSQKNYFETNKPKIVYVKSKITEYSLAQEIEKLNQIKHKKQKLLDIKESERARVFLRTHSTTQQELLAELTKEDILQILRFLDPDEVTDALQKIYDEKKRKYVLEELQEEEKHKVEFLLRFHPESAAGLMNLDYILVSANQSLSSVNKSVLKHEKRTGKFPTILAEQEGIIIGELQGHYLSIRNPKEKVSKHLTKIFSVKYDEPQENILKIFRETRHKKVVVFDDTNAVIGVIYSDDILRILQDEPTQSLYSYAGLKKEETINDTIKEKVKHRYKWLIVSLIASFVVAASITPFEHTIERIVLLAIYLPIVAMIGGNAATQTLAVIVRGLTLNQITRANAKKILFKEIIAGIINGLIVGFFVGIITFFINKNFMFGVVISLAMIFNLFVATLFGTIIPLGIKKLGKDPATSAIMFITTATDVFGFFAFLGLASILL